MQKLEGDDRHIVYNYAAKELNLSMTKLDSEVIAKFVTLNILNLGGVELMD